MRHFTHTTPPIVTWLSELFCLVHMLNFNGVRPAKSDAHERFPILDVKADREAFGDSIPVEPRRGLLLVHRNT